MLSPQAMTYKDVYTAGFNLFRWELEPIVHRAHGAKASARVLKLQLNYNFAHDLIKQRYEQNAGALAVFLSDRDRGRTTDHKL